MICDVQQIVYTLIKYTGDRRYSGVRVLVSTEASYRLDMIGRFPLSLKTALLRAQSSLQPAM